MSDESEGWKDPVEEDDDDELPSIEQESEEEVPAEPIRAVLASAHELGDEGDFEGMAVRLREGLGDYPTDPFLLCWLGVAERELGLAGPAYERFRACLQARPTDPHILATAGNGVAAFDDPEALGALRTAALLAPELPLTRWLYGAYLIREGMLEEGLAELIAARDLDPEDAGIRYELGVGLALGGRRAEAVDEIYRSIELEPGDGWAHVVLGLLLSEEQRAEEAAGVLEDGARLRPEDIEAQLIAGLAAAAAGMEDTGFEMVERARQWAEGADRVLVDEIESRLDEGPEEAAAWLAEQIGPASLRERMMTRP
jgi:tetratricopeptide (TPR) repeat protein